MNSLRLVYPASGAIKEYHWLEGSVITRVAVSMFLMTGVAFLLYCWRRFHGEAKRQAVEKWRGLVPNAIRLRDSERAGKSGWQSAAKRAMTLEDWGQEKADPLGREAGRF